MATFGDLHDENEVERLRLTVERLSQELEAARNDRRYALHRLVRAEYAIKRHHLAVTEKGFSSAEDRELWESLTFPVDDGQ